MSQIITRSTEPRVVDIEKWRRRYTEAVAVERRNRERAIRESIDAHCDHHQLTPRIRAAAQACAMRLYRNGSSAAAAISAGKRRATDLAWGDPDGAA